ncbi:hypothetical protein B5F40_04295 [Gordonibacter sp. An230]|nr:hypothetical protein B5F40_04295 [Gordonibacter sp. An230]
MTRERDLKMIENAVCGRVATRKMVSQRDFGTVWAMARECGLGMIGGWPESAASGRPWERGGGATVPMGFS